MISAAIINGAPFSFSNQQDMVLKNVMLETMFEIDTLLLILRQPNTHQIRLATVRNNESLMDIAARTLGNFELWTDIVTLNGLIPPYVGPDPLPGIAGWGTKILLPTPGTALAPVGTLPSYNINFLGVDLYIGPINGPMPPWNGDFQVITGYPNLAWALGRRLQTVIGALIYHTNYGSRIPPEVGAIQTLASAQNINAYGQSAINSDPRVLSCISSTATIGELGFVIFQAAVQPRGFANAPVAVNEVLQPQ
jgi:phage baseplate assembly protein W